jgi:hypothetical protein
MFHAKDSAMKNHSSLASSAVISMFSCILFFCSSAHAGLLRYDMVYDGEPLGHLVFDAQLDAPSQNLWPSLVDWMLAWNEVVLNPSNSAAANADSRFVVDALGNVISDSIETIICTGPFFCAPRHLVRDYPEFEGSDGSRMGFFLNSLQGGALFVTSASGDYYLSRDAHFRRLEYVGPLAVPLPATIWLLITALLGFVVTSYRKLP